MNADDFRRELAEIDAEARRIRDAVARCSFLLSPRGFRLRSDLKALERRLGDLRSALRARAEVMA